LGRLDSPQPGVGEARPIQVDHPHEASVLVGLEAQHLIQHRPQAQLLDGCAFPAGRDRARDRVVVEVQQVIRQAGVGAAQQGHLMVLAVGKALAGEQRTQRPAAPRPGRSAARSCAVSVTGSVTRVSSAVAARS
jgi:uncharacterized Zn-binding protein involved in type VI secretion